MFSIYLQLGIQHITDLQSYDHILFLIVLCAAYSLKEKKQLFILITAFTIGHSFTLVLAALKIIMFPPNLIEILIPVTIILSGFLNIFLKTSKFKKHLHYSLALCFGLIHGLGFSNYLQQLLGSETNIVNPLLAFNIGVELGQIIILLILFLIYSTLNQIIKITPRKWNISISVAGSFLAVFILLQRFSF